MFRTIIIERWALARRLLPADVYVAAKAVLLAAVAIQLARLAWAILTPVGPLGEWRPAQARILPKQAQAVLLGAVDPFFRNVAAATIAALPAIDLKLFGVREDRGPGGGAAIIGSADGQQQSVAVGEEIMPGARLYAVAFDYVVIDRGGRQEKLFLDQSKPAQLVAGGNGPAGAVETVGAPPLTPEAVRRAVSLAPRSIAGRVTGATVAPGADTQTFAATGLQPGDVIVAVNGVRIASATDLAQLQSGLAPGAQLSLTVERGAATVPIALNLAGER